VKGDGNSRRVKDSHTSTIQTPICCVQRNSGADRQQIERSSPPELTGAASAVEHR
jgi:hypothetical protein